MKRITSLLLAISMIVFLVSCSKYRNSYSAVMLVKSSGGDHCETSFGSLKGTLVLKATAKDDDIDGFIHYEASLLEGEVSVYYDIDGTKELLFTIKSGEKLDSKGGKVSKGDKVTFIIETVDTAKNGDIEIDFD